MVPQAVDGGTSVHRSNGGRDGGSIIHVDPTLFNSATDPSIGLDLLNERSGGLHSTSSILSCFESDSSISDQSDASYHHINTTQTHVYKPTKSSKFNKFPKNNNTRCWLCDPKSYKGNSSRTFHPKTPCENFVKCLNSSCGKISCYSCIKCILDSMKSKKSHNPWFIEYKNVIQQGKTTSLFCHACEYDDPTTLKSTNHPVPKELGKFSGALFFPDFKLIILSPPTGIVDVLSMGNYTPRPIDLVLNPNAYAVKGAWHCVFSNLFAHQLHEEKLTGIPITSVFSPVEFTTTIPMLNATTEASFKIHLYNIGFPKIDIAKDMKGLNSFETNDIKQLVVFGDNLREDVDMSMIIARNPSSKEYMLLNLRYHHKMRSSTKHNFDHEIERFYKVSTQYMKFGKKEKRKSHIQIKD